MIIFALLSYQKLAQTFGISFNHTYLYFCIENYIFWIFNESVRTEVD